MTALTHQTHSQVAHLTDADVQAAYRELDHGRPSNPIAVPDQN